MRRGRACPFENPIWSAIALMGASRSDFSPMLTVVKSLRGVIPWLFNSRSAIHLESPELRHPLNLVTRLATIGVTRCECVDHLAAFNEWTFAASSCYVCSLTHGVLGLDVPTTLLRRRGDRVKGAGGTANMVVDTAHLCRAGVASSSFDHV
jgi:hypothetical protein